MDVFGVFFFLGAFAAVVSLLIVIVQSIFKSKGSKKLPLMVLSAGVIVSIASVTAGVATEGPAIKEQRRIEQAAMVEAKVAEKEQAAIEAAETTTSEVENEVGSSSNGSADGTRTEEKVEAKTPPPPEKIDFSKAELTKENVIKLLEELDSLYLESEDIKEVSFDEPGEVWIKSSPEYFWDEKQLVKQTGIGMVKISRELFKNPNVKAVVISVWTSFVDQYGKESDERALSIRWTREVNDKVDYKNFKNMVISDYKKAFEIATSYTIHPGIAKEID